MITAKFGSKEFKVAGDIIHTPSDVSISESVDIKETERSGKKPSTKVNGIKLQTASFKILLDARFVSIISELRWWKSTMFSKSAKDFSIGWYRLGRFYISQYDVSDIQINKKREWIKATLSITLTEDGNYAGKTTINFKDNRYVSSVTTSLSAKVTKKIRVGSSVRPVEGTRIYSTAYNAVNKTGTSNKVTVFIYKITEIYRVSSGNYGIRIEGKYRGETFAGWMRSEDLTLINY